MSWVTHEWKTKLKHLLCSQTDQVWYSTYLLPAFGAAPAATWHTLWLKARKKRSYLFSALMSLPLSSSSRRQLQVLFNLQPSSTVHRSAALSFFAAAGSTTRLSAALLYCCGCPWVNFMYIQIINANASALSQLNTAHTGEKYQSFVEIFQIL